jgi:diacylglycerol kinase family enzyme
VRPGQAWGEPGTDPPDLEVEGGDAELAAAAARAGPGARVRFRPDESSDLARALGLVPGAAAIGVEVAVDVLALDDGRPAVNAVVMGIPPDRLRRWHRAVPTRIEIDGRTVFDGTATTVVVASGQYLRGLDVVPRGHPGDGRVEVQVYALRPGERAGMRRRLAVGGHVPHPRIQQRSGRVVRVEQGRAGPLEVDGEARGAAAAVALEVVPGGLHLAL